MRTKSQIVLHNQVVSVEHNQILSITRDVVQLMNETNKYLADSEHILQQVLILR